MRWRWNGKCTTRHRKVLQDSVKSRDQGLKGREHRREKHRKVRRDIKYLLERLGKQEGEPKRDLGNTDINIEKLQ